ncbi:MAG: hypothetical protein J5590_00700 [Clostridia bacterium]|nr:hypothetical protein [Clostridia bacterium]
MKKYICILLAISMLLMMCINISADSFTKYTPESAGPMNYSLDLRYPVSANGASVSGSYLNMPAGSSAEYDIFFDYDVENLQVSYQATAAGTLTVGVDGNSYQLSLAAGSYTVNKDIIERKGSHTISLSFAGTGLITDVSFKKAKIDNTGISQQYTVYNIDYNDYDKAMQTAVAVSTSKVAIKVNGAFRYLDYTDTSLSPLNIDGRIYLPIHAAARAFSLYYEDYPDKAYAYLSNDDFEIYQKENDCYVVINGEKIDNYGRFAIYLNGTTWVPFRQLAELLGEKVEWRQDHRGNGYAIADDRIRAKAIVSNDDIFNDLVDEFSQFDVSGLRRNKTYYVSQTAGSDTNIGTSEAAPFATIQKAADVAQAGDTVIIHGGVYRETVKVKNSGTATQPIVFKAADGEDVTISAFDKVSGFTKSSYNQNGYDLYQVTLAKSMGYDRNFVIRNDEILREGRYPDNDDHPLVSPHPNMNENVMRATMGNIAMPSPSAVSGKTFTYTTTDGTFSKAYEYDFAISDTDLNQSKNYWKDGTFVTLTGQAYTLSYARIDASDNHIGANDNIGWIHLIDNNKGGYDFVGPEKENQNLFYKSKNSDDYGYITHHLKTVTLPGEWYVDHSKKILYIIPPEGVSGSALEVEVKQRQCVIDMTGKSFVQFHDINTRGGGVTMAAQFTNGEVTDTEMDILDGGTHKYISQIDWTAAHATHDGRYIYRQQTNRVATKNQDGPELGEVGFYTHGKNNAIVNTHIAYSAQAGIYTTGLYTYIENNYVENASYMGSYPGAITLEGVKWNSDPGAKSGGHTVVANTMVGSGRGNLYLSRGVAYANSSKVDPETMYPYIACDLSYNRIQMGAVSSRDTGSVYIYGTSAGNDLLKTRLHHNIIYDMGTLEKNSMMNALIYHDGYANFINTYSNMTFDTAKGYVGYDLFQHTSADHYRNYVEKWGNVSLGTITSGVTCDMQDTFSKKDYPYGKPFDVGSTRDGHRRFMLNYNDDADCAIRYAGEAADATLSSNASLGEDGFVTLPSSSDYIDFKNVKFYDTGTEFSIFYSSDRYQYGTNVGTEAKPRYESAIPKFTIELRNGNSVVRTITEDVYSHATNLENESRFIMYFKPQTTATYTVRLKVDKNYVRPCKLMSAKLDFNAKAQEDWPYPFDGDTFLFGPLPNTNGYNENENLKLDDLSIHNKINHSFGDVSTSYFTISSKYFTSSENKVSIKISTDYHYTNGVIKVYENSRIQRNLLAEFNLADYIQPTADGNAAVWRPFVLTKTMNKTLAQGNHTIYVVFDKYDQSGAYPTVSAFWISFHSRDFSGSSPTLASLQQ